MIITVSDAEAQGGIRVVADVGEIDFVIEVDTESRRATVFDSDGLGHFIVADGGKDLVRKDVSAAGWKLYSKRTGELLATVPD